MTAIGLMVFLGGFAFASFFFLGGDRIARRRGFEVGWRARDRESAVPVAPPPRAEIDALIAADTEQLDGGGE